MRELSVYYCPKCGYFAFYQLPKNAVCHECCLAMTRLDIPYQDFTDLDHEERDRLISVKMIESAPSLVKRITATEKLHRQRKLVGALVERNMELESEINTLNATIDWMHETIWKQLRVKQALTEELRDLKTSSEPERLNS